MTDPLTPRQREVYRFLERSLEERGFPPTVAEIASHFGMRSPNAAAQHLRLMAQKGALEIEPGAARGIRLLGDGAQRTPKRRVSTTRARGPGASLPIVGRVAAGSPILAEENREGALAIAPAAFRPRADYLLRVVGDSMEGAGILDGDLVAVRRTPEVRDGAVAVVRIGDEVTVKRFRRSGACVELLPESRTHGRRVVDLTKESLTIEGEVVGVVRLGAG